MRTSGLEQGVNGSGEGPVVAPAMQFAQRGKRVADGREIGIEIFRQFTHGMEMAVLIAEAEKDVIGNGVRAAAQDGEDAQLVIGPLDGAESGAQGGDLLPLVKRFGADQEVWDATRFEATHVLLGEIGSVIGKAAEE